MTTIAIEKIARDSFYAELTKIAQDHNDDSVIKIASMLDADSVESLIKQAFFGQAASGLKNVASRAGGLWDNAKSWLQRGASAVRGNPAVPMESAFSQYVKDPLAAAGRSMGESIGHLRRGDQLAPEMKQLGNRVTRIESNPAATLQHVFPGTLADRKNLLDSGLAGIRADLARAGVHLPDASGAYNVGAPGNRRVTSHDTGYPVDQLLQRHGHVVPSSAYAAGLNADMPNIIHQAGLRSAPKTVPGYESPLPPGLLAQMQQTPREEWGRYF